MSSQVAKVDQNALLDTTLEEIEAIHLNLMYGISAFDVLGMAAINAGEISIGDAAQVLKIYFKSLADRLDALLKV